MRIAKNKKSLLILFFFCFNILISISFIEISAQINLKDNISNLKSPKTSQAGVGGRIYSSISDTDRLCYINRDNPNSNHQPSIYIPNYYISSANMVFDNIMVDNYTKIIESESTQHISNAYKNRELYVYQKFHIRLSQNVNNISILIQDNIDKYEYNEANSWEIAIMNCTNDEYGTPNNNHTLGELKREHPLDNSAQMYAFDFQHSEVGPVFLNISKTYSTIEDGITKYWFAYRVKIPANDSRIAHTGEIVGGIKTLYFNPDGGDPSNKGEGETFLFYPKVPFENFTSNYVSKIGIGTPINGTYMSGSLDSFIDKDEDRYVAKSLTNNLTTEFFFNIKNMTKYGFDFLQSQDDVWWRTNVPIKSVDIEVSTKIGKIENVKNANFYVWNYSGVSGRDPPNDLDWVNLTSDFETTINLNTMNERILIARLNNTMDNELVIKNFLSLMNASDNNTMRFKFEYNGIGNFNVSINKFSIALGDPLITLNNTVLSYDPLIKHLYYPSEVITWNGTPSTPDLQLLKYPDDEYYRAQALTNNLSIDFKFEFLPDIDPYIWSGLDINDWLNVYPHPYVPLIDLYFSANVSKPLALNYNYAFVEVYDRFTQTWRPLINLRPFLFLGDFLLPIPLNETNSWIILQISDPDDHNSFKMRLSYNSTPSNPNFNVTVDVFSMSFNIQNIFSSDICSKIGFGLDNNKITPSGIEMKNFGIPINDLEFGNGTWNHGLTNNVPEQGTYEFNVSSMWPSVYFDVTGAYSVYKYAIELDFVDDMETQYMSGGESFTVEVTDGSGSPVPNLEILFELLDADDKVIDEDKATTNSEGEATGTLDLSDLGSGFYIRATYEKEGIYASDDTDSDEFRVVDDFTIFMDNFLFLLPYILIGLAGLFVFVTVRHQRLKKLRAKWSNDALILEDLLKISHIMIIQKEGGLTLYNKQISMDLDSDLISGFITAISQFRSEIKKPTEGISKGAGGGFEMDYHDFKIDMTDGDYIRTALILEGIPSQILKDNQQQFTNTFETKFKPLLADFKGDIKPFKETDNLIERYFNLSLMYPLQLAKHWQFSKLNKLETILLEVANQMQKERKYFFVSSLLNYGIAGRKESKNQIISTIVGLKKRGLFVPLENI